LWESKEIERKRDMKFLRHCSIKWKLTLVTLFSCGIVLLLACATLFAFQLIAFRLNVIRDLSTLGELLAANSTEAVASRDHKAASEILSAVKTKPQIVCASIQLNVGAVFVRYGQLDDRDKIATNPLRSGFRFEGDHLLLACPIAFRGERIGTLYLRSDFQSAYRDLFQLYGGILTAVLGASLLFVLLLSNPLQRVISTPILKLADIAKAVAQQKNYSVRAEYLGRDELGCPSEAFNQMLDQIQANDSNLRQINLALEGEIVERKQAQAAQSRVAAILEATTDCVASADEQGRVLYLNRAGRRMLGLDDTEEVSRTAIPDFYPKWAGNIILNTALPTAIREGVWSGETALLTRGGEEIQVSQVFTAHKAADGKVEYFSTVARDITERKQAERIKQQRLEKTLCRQRVLLQISQQGTLKFLDRLRNILKEAASVLNVERVSFWRLIEEGNAIECQEQYLLSKQEFDGTAMRIKASSCLKYFQALHSETNLNLIVVNDAVTDEVTSDLVDSYLSPFGITSMLDAPVRRNGRVLGVVCHEHTGPARIWTAGEIDFVSSIAQLVALGIETHERAQAEAALRLSQQKFQSLVNSIEGVVWEADPRMSHFTFASQQAERLLDYPFGMWTVQPGFWQEHLHSHDRARVVEMCRQAAAEKRPLHCEYRMIALAGREVWVRHIANVVVEKDGVESLRGCCWTSQNRKRPSRNWPL
jgi:PAS domain S-box-containing protein